VRISFVPGDPPNSNQPSPPPDNFAAAVAELSKGQQIRSPRLRTLVQGFRSKRPEIAEQELRQYLAKHPDDGDALVLLAQAAARRGRQRERAALLGRTVKLSPDFLPVRADYAELLFALNRFDAALDQVDALLQRSPGNPLFRQLKAKVLESLGEYHTSLTILEELAHENPGRSESWLQYGHALRTVGRQEDSIAAYRKAIELNAASALAYANLANLKTFRFSDNDVAAMQALLARAGTSPEDRVNLQFALGKALEDRGAYAQAFEAYSKGNATARLRLNYNPDALTMGMRRTKGAFTRDFFAARAGAGCPAPDPIFIVGRQRSGSTLIEQILASHSAIEGTAELPYIPDLVAEIADVEGPAGGAQYFENLAKLPPEALARLGEEYLSRARLHRKTARPFFIDKNPGNHFHTGLIALIMPNAKIIDARRNPAAVCWSQFTHHFTLTNLRLPEFAQAWRDYAELMAHFDAVLPGRIHRVIYEDLIADPEAEVRELLDYLGLPFEESCLRFYESERAVLTPSSEQVRQPLTDDAIDHWRHFEPWLDPLLRTLGTAFTAYPAVPEELR
jgi:cytochrome c-type biogenesis protein CcmH/NrfG